jgi:hypothetical protein
MVWDPSMRTEKVFGGEELLKPRKIARLLLAIFGAGASCDSSPAYPLENTGIIQGRPPLANELFDMRFGNVIDYFPRAKPVITDLLPRIGGDPVNVESVLEGLQAKATAGEAEEYSQLAAVQFYLQAMLLQCTYQWTQTTKSVTNYATLMNQIRSSKEPACLVTFNYDTLLEDALSLPTFGVRFRSLSDYVSSDYKVIKVHGSVNWAHEVKTPIENVRGQNQLQVASQIIDRRPKLVVDGAFEIVHQGLEDIRRGYPIGKAGERPMLPALAVPVENKPGDELPPPHRKVLEECLPQVTKVLVVGWRASESRFLGMLAERLSHGSPRFMIVSRSEAGATKTWNTISERLRAASVTVNDVKISKKSFTYAVRDHDIENFLKN